MVKPLDKAQPARKTQTSIFAALSLSEPLA